MSSSINPDISPEEHPLLSRPSTPTESWHVKEEGAPIDSRLNHWDPTISTTREARQYALEASSAVCLALSVVLRVASGLATMPHAHVVQMALAAIGALLALAAAAIRCADVATPMALAFANGVSGALAVLEINPSSAIGWIDHHARSVEAANYIISGIALAIFLHFVLLRRHSKRLWQQFSRSDPWMALPDSFATVHYTEFGHVIDRAPRAFAHARPNKTLTAGRVPGANVGVDFTRCPSYGSRQYEVDGAVRVDFDDLAKTRRARISKRHFIVVQPANTNDVYIKFNRRSARAMNYVGYEAQGRFESRTLRWAGGKSEPTDQQQSPPGKFVLGEDTILRQVPDNALNDPIKVLDYAALQQQIQIAVLSGVNPRVSLGHRTRVLVAVGGTGGSESMYDRHGVVAFRIILHNAARLLRDAPCPVVENSPPKRLQPSPRSVKKDAALKRELDELRQANAALIADVAEERSRKETAVQGWQRASTQAEEAQNSLEMLKVKADAKVRKLKDRNSALATEGANLKLQLQDITRVNEQSPPKTRAVTFRSSVTSEHDESVEPAEDSHTLTSPEKHEKKIPTILTFEEQAVNNEGSVSNGQGSPKRPSRSKEPNVSPTVAPRKKGLNRAAPPGSPSLSQRRRILEHVEAVATSPKPTRQLSPRPVSLFDD